MSTTDTNRDGAGADDRHDPLIELLPRVRRESRWQRLWRPFWMLPTCILAAAAVLGLVLPLLDRSFDQHLDLFYQGGPSGARDLLGNIAGAMISVTGLVFSITMVVIQLASSQFTPRGLDDFLASRITQTTLGVFAASFVYSLAVHRSVRGDADGIDAFVPQISVTVAFLLVLASVGLFMAFIHHITDSIKVTTIVSHLGETTMRVVDRYFPHPSRFDDLDDPPADRFSPPAGTRAEEVLAEQHGNVTEVDHRRLLDWAVEHDAIVEVVPPVGEFVVEGATAMRVWRDAGADELDDAERRALRAAVVVEQDRRFTQDPAFGIRKLVDIAERALSSGINDPTTAVQVLDELHRVLRTLVQQQDLPHSVPHEGVVRLVHRPQRVDELIDLGLEEVLHYAGGTLQVPRKVIAMLQDAGAVARDEHRERLRHWERIAGELVAETSKRDAAGA